MMVREITVYLKDAANGTIHNHRDVEVETGPNGVDVFYPKTKLQVSYPIANLLTWKMWLP